MSTLGGVLCVLCCQGFGSKKMQCVGCYVKDWDSVLTCVPTNDRGVLQEDEKIAIWVVKVNF